MTGLGKAINHNTSTMKSKWLRRARAFRKVLAGLASQPFAYLKNRKTLNSSLGDLSNITSQQRVIQAKTRHLRFDFFLNCQHDKNKVKICRHCNV